MMTGCLTAEDYFEKAKKFESEDKTEQALYCYDEAISLDSGMTKAYEARADLFFKTDMYQNALDDYTFLSNIYKDNLYIEKCAICNEFLGRPEESIRLYTKLLLEDVNPEAYKNIYRIAEYAADIKAKINFSDIDYLMKNYVNEEKALKFRDAADEYDLDQRNDFLELYITLLPKDSKYMYEAHILKAQAEIFRYRICFDKNFRDEIKRTENITEDELNKKYKYTAKRLSELNLVFAIQKFNEATRYASNLAEVNFLDSEINKIVQSCDYEK